MDDFQILTLQQCNKIFNLLFVGNLNDDSDNKKTLGL